MSKSDLHLTRIKSLGPFDSDLCEVYGKSTLVKG